MGNFTSQDYVVIGKKESIEIISWLSWVEILPGYDIGIELPLLTFIKIISIWLLLLLIF